MQIGAGVVAAADAVVGLDVDGVDRLAVFIEFVLLHPHAAFVIQPHAVVEIRGFVMEGAAFGREVGDGIAPAGDVEGAAHAQMGELGGDIGVAFRAAGVVDVAVRDQFGVW